MGTPKQLYEFSVREMHDTLSLAKETAMDFRSLDARIKALDHLRISLLPMVEWLDKPIKECFPYHETTSSMKRALLLFKQFRELLPVVLTRKGDWVTLTPNDAKVMSVSSGWLASAISHSRHDILEAVPWGHRTENVVVAESMGMREVVEHCAFLKYLTLGMKALDEALREREERMCTMRGNLSFLKSFVGGMDPLEYGAPKSLLPGYALFNRHSRGIGRSSGTYFVPGPVGKEAAERNKRNLSGSDFEYYVYSDGHSRFNKLEEFLSKVRYSIENVSDGGVFKRGPLSDEEVRVITDFARGIGNPPA